ncbi:hypothetical protein Tco_1541461 [Tanacetum coccineum]
MPLGLVLWFPRCVTFLFGSGDSSRIVEGCGGRIISSLELSNVFVEALCQFKVVNPMHESGGSHALMGPLHASNFNLESLYEILDGLFIPLLDIVISH